MPGWMKAALIALLALTGACSKDLPDLTEPAWTSLEVEYCTPGQTTRTWATRDPAVLETLRASLRPAPPSGLTMILNSYTNEIRLEQASGQRWRLYFRDSPTSITFHDPDAIKRSFRTRVSGDFHAQLSSLLQAAGGTGISLRGDCRIPSMAGK